MTLRIKIYRDNVDMALRVLKKKMHGEGTMVGVWSHDRYTKPCDKRRQEREHREYTMKMKREMENFRVLMRRQARGF